MQFGRTLVIDSAMQPIKVIDWQTAILLVLKNKARVIDAYDNVLIHSATQAYKLPSVLMIVSKNKRKKEINFSKRAIFYRDNYTCAYCGDRFKPSELSQDHVIPACQGGTKCWENIVTSCRECNSKKGGRTPDEARMELKFLPHKPNWNPSLFIQLKKSDPIERWEFFVGSLKVEVG